jgi:type II restriction enzyme
MPFHVRLLGKERVAIFSFIQSINTSMGMSIFEQMAVIIAAQHFKRAIRQYKDFNNTISEDTQVIIQHIMDNLRSGWTKPDKPKEIADILRVAQGGKIKDVKSPRIDLFLESEEGIEYYFDIKTAKENRGKCFGLKRELLEWVAIRGTVNPNPNIFTGLAIPYNPYEPNPYNRWTFQGIFDLPNELKVAEEFWDFLGGENTYDDLLGVFEEVGIELRPEIDEMFKMFEDK